MLGHSDEYQTLVHNTGTTTSAPIPRVQRNRRNDWFMQSSYVMLGLGTILAILVGASFTVIPPGEVGIVVTLGRASTFVPGAHFRAPIISYLDLMSTKTQLLEQKNAIPTKEGLAVQLDTAV